MKKTTAKLMAALAVGLGATQVCAQSSVTLFGLVDVGLEYANAGQGSITRVQSGQWFGSRFGLRGSEDLGGGFSAVFTIEAGIRADDGGGTEFGTNVTKPAGQTTTYDRQIFAGVTNPSFGQLLFGRQYSLTDVVKGTVEPFTNGTVGDTSGLRQLNPSRTDNAVKYITPSWGGFSVSGLYSTGQEQAQTATQSSNASRQVEVGTAFARGPVYIGGAYDITRGNTALTALRSDVAKTKSWIVGATYDIVKIVKLHAWYNGLKADALGSGADLIAARDVRAWAAGITWNILPTTNVRFAYGQRDDKTSNDRDANKWGVGFFHDLSKRTTLYTAYSKLTNEDRFTGTGAANGAGIALGSGANAGPALLNANSDPWGFNIGMRHSF